jgi:hypothetical protein
VLSASGRRRWRRFPEVGQELLAETVEGLYHGFGGSRVRTFVPVLVENEARDVLGG